MIKQIKRLLDVKSKIEWELIINKIINNVQDYEIEIIPDDNKINAYIMLKRPVNEIKVNIILRKLIK